MEWLQKFFSEKGTLGVIFTAGAVGAVGGIAQGVVQKKHGGWPAFFQALLIGIAISVIVGLGIKDYVQSEAFRLAIVGGAAVISDDIWASLRALGRLFREDPLGSLARLIDALRGKTPAPAAAPAAAAAAPKVFSPKED